MKEKILLWLLNIVSWFTVSCPAQKCQFWKVCEHYRENSAACNHWKQRFLSDGRAYCGKYRELEEKERLDKPAGYIERKLML